MPAQQSLALGRTPRQLIVCIFGDVTGEAMLMRRRDQSATLHDMQRWAALSHAALGSSQSCSAGQLSVMQRWAALSHAKACRTVLLPHIQTSGGLRTNHILLSHSTIHPSIHPSIHQSIHIPSLWQPSQSALILHHLPATLPGMHITTSRLTLQARTGALKSRHRRLHCCTTPPTALNVSVGQPAADSAAGCCWHSE
jgi:hypothetical protein